MYCKNQIVNFLKEEGLILNPKSQIIPIKQGIDFLGFHVYITASGKIIKKIRKHSKQTMRRKLKHFQKEYAAERMEIDQINTVVNSWIGHARRGNTYNLRRKMFSKYKFVRSEGNAKRE